MYNVNVICMETEPLVAVLISTYNGAKYIKEQIDSILNQKGVKVKIFIRDDISSDSTIDIVNSYNDPRICILKSTENLGVGLSFLTLLSIVTKQEPDIEYFAYSDQDDIWLEDKLQVAVSKISNCYCPTIYGSNYNLYFNGQKNELKLKEDFYPLDIFDVINHNEISGCTMVFNRKLACIVSKINFPTRILDCKFHDSWTLIIGMAKGIFVYDKNSYILHRIHDKNVYGLHEPPLTKKAISILKFGFKNFFKPNFVSKFQKRLDQIGIGYVSHTSNYFLQSVPDYSGADLERIKLTANYRNSLKDKIKLLSNARNCKRKEESILFFKIKVLLNLI